MTISFEQALALCRSDPEAAARLICDLSARVDAQQRQIDLLLQKVSGLERTVAKLSRNSTNSGKPPSSDITRPKPQQRQQGKRKIGAQPGHPRHERPAFPEADIKKTPTTTGSMPVRSAATRRSRSWTNLCACPYRPL